MLVLWVLAAQPPCETFHYLLVLHPHFPSNHLSFFPLSLPLTLSSCLFCQFLLPRRSSLPPQGLLILRFDGGFTFFPEFSLSGSFICSKSTRSLNSGCMSDMGLRFYVSNKRCVHSVFNQYLLSTFSVLGATVNGSTRRA